MKTVTFAARVREQIMNMESPQPKLNAAGRQIGETAGRQIEFKNGIYQTSDPDEIEWIRSRLRAPDAPEGVFEVSREALAPDHTETLVEVASASIERTVEILREERENWQRKAIIDACTQKIEAHNDEFKPKPGRPKVAKPVPERVLEG